MEKSYNGWTASPNPADFGGITKLVVAGEEFAPGVRSGDVYTIFQWLANQLNERVEPIVKDGWHQADDWGYSYRTNRNANNLSCHASATAIDYNATRHPNKKGGTFTPAQVVEIKKIISSSQNCLRWGGSFTGVLDEMHWEIVGNETQARAFANWIRGVQVVPGSVISSAPFLEYGQTSDEVRRLQEILTTRYPSYAKWSPITNYFGAQTLAAVKEFQRRTPGLTADGIVGPATRKALGL